MDFLARLGIQSINSGAYNGEWLDCTNGDILDSLSPHNNEVIASVRMASEKEYEQTILAAHNCFKKWRMVPAPKRGEIMRQIGDILREYKEDLGKLVSLEMGKILVEGEGEVQEMIDITDYSVGLSRQLYGFTMHSERYMHRMYEQYHPLGIVGIISAFNFPVAVWSWNAMIAAVCGDTMIWKPSSKTPLTAIAVQNIIHPVLKKHDLQGLMNLVIGRGSLIGEKLINDYRVQLISATGSCRMGKRIGAVVGQRLGKSILELGGNNALIILNDADLNLALRAVLFGAVGTAGQRCTTTRRVILEKNIAQEFTERLIQAYNGIKIGNPLSEETLMGPLVDKQALDEMMNAIKIIKQEGAQILSGGTAYLENECAKGNYVLPTIVKASKDLKIMQEETFAPILYLVTVENLDEAITAQNEVRQGLSSSIFTTNLLSAEKYLGHLGSDCGIANVNIGTSGAEIGGAFGGEKETGGGREAGSDSWKMYMRRQTNTINWSKELPLAQGIEFG